jgi:tRNA-dihydrouridine synthase B
MPHGQATQRSGHTRIVKIGTFELASNLLLAPIAGYCDLAYRLCVRRLGGVGLATTDLVNPRGLLRGTRNSLELVATEAGDQPLCIQLYGPDPAEMATAAQWCEANGAEVIDINMGCSVDKVCRQNAGAALLRDTGLAVRVAERVVRAVRRPVTVKMRLGWKQDDVAPGLARALEDVGVAAVTVHGRTAAQKFGGDVQLEGIARVVEAVRGIPVIGNGDVHGPADAVEMMRRTGCAGVMIGRAALSDAWIFRDTQALLSGEPVPPAPSLADRLGFMSEHFAELVRIRGERVACKVFRQRVTWYARRLRPCRQFVLRMRKLESAEEFAEIVSSWGSEKQEVRSEKLEVEK